MRSVVLTLLLLAIISLSWREVRARQRANISPSFIDQSAIGETDFERSHKSPDNDGNVKRLRTRNQTGSNSEVRKIHLDSEEDIPGIRAYGLPRKRLQDNGVIERVHVREDGINDAPRSARMVEVYGLPKKKMETNGLIERLPVVPAVNHQTTKLGLDEDIEVRARRSIREEAGNKIEEKVASEAEDMQTQDTKVFRPLFVYRRQMAAKQERKRLRKLNHRHHRYPNHQYCHH